MPAEYKGVLVEQRIVVERKAVEKVTPIFGSQLLTYLRRSGIRVGLPINFNVPVPEDGITRRVP